ncbi:MAG TPA: hypothetical protein VEI06_07290 [Gemmatimonadaceae bacterium]|nr:hypothetical protein [Gemmatimonadaceae bacterium]
MILALLVAVGASACGDSALAPPPAGPTAPAPTAIDYPEIAGVYDLTGVIQAFDPAWGDLTGERFEAVLTILPSRNARQFTGMFTDVRYVSPTGDTAAVEPSVIAGSLDADGKVTLESSWNSWYGAGAFASGEIMGEFGCCGHISGRFAATRR